MTITADAESRDAQFYDAKYARSKEYAKPYHESVYYHLWCVVADRLNMQGARSVLDLGCGSGQFAACLSDHGIAQYRGIDFSQTAIQRARQRVPRYQFDLVDLRHMAHSAYRGVDAITCLEVLEHLDDDTGLLSRLPAGKRLLATVPNFLCPGHVRCFETAAEVRERYGPYLRRMSVTAWRNPVGPTMWLIDGVTPGHSETGQVSAWRPLICSHRRRDGINWRIHDGFLAYAPEMAITPAYYGPRLGRVPVGLAAQFRDETVAETVRRVGADSVLFYRSGHYDLDWIDMPSLHGRRRHDVIPGSRPAAIPLGKLDVPSAVIDVDGYYLGGFDGDISEHVDVHFLRAYDQLADRSPCSMVEELAFSVDPASYVKVHARGREGIGYSGHRKWSMRGRQPRRYALDRLDGVVRIAHKSCQGQDQIDFYRSCRAALTCDGGVKALTAKHFEIPAAGAVLVTSGRAGIERHLPAGTWLTYTARGNGVVEAWREIDRNWYKVWRHRAKQAEIHVLRTATHERRWMSVFDALRSLGWEPGT